MNSAAGGMELEECNLNHIFLADNVVCGSPRRNIHDLFQSQPLFIGGAGVNETCCSVVRNFCDAITEAAITENQVPV